MGIFQAKCFKDALLLFNANRHLGKSSNGKNRDWVSLLIYKEVAGEAGRRILA